MLFIEIFIKRDLVIKKLLVIKAIRTHLIWDKKLKMFDIRVDY